ncbi:hypothetical protein CASFOL_017470 [Castilleja foliolosa]|uniref:Ubiquitin-like protease family profile domain-containing protein n=1 Tax=Castilleja foliolosa TaxID=1961234 RepID=A0ABD3DBM6_9LAMI
MKKRLAVRKSDETKSKKARKVDDVVVPDERRLQEDAEFHTPPEEPHEVGDKEEHQEAAPTAEEEDSDFETPPRAQKPVDLKRTLKLKKATAAKGKSTVVENQAEAVIFPKLGYRNSPGVLAEAFSRMSKPQRASIDAMGYGRLKDMKIHELPITLSYWLLENFDPKSCVIKLQRGRELRVEDDDAAIVLGLHRGTTTIKRQWKKEVHPLIKDFKTMFPLGTSITAPKVMEKLLTLDTEDVWFRRLFLILMKTVLVECLGNGYVTTQTIPNFENVDDAIRLNWGRYMKRCLVESVTRWQKKKTRPYGGPIVLLLGLYVDRVDLFTGSVVPRAFPSIKGWTSKLLKKREEDEKSCESFGHGYPIARWEGLNDAMNQTASASDVGGYEHSKAGIPEPDDEDNDANNNEKERAEEKGEHAAQVFAEKFLKKSKLVADTMTELIGMVKNAPMNIMSNIHFRDVFGKTEELLGCKIPIPPADTVPEDDGFTGTQADNEFFANPEIMAIIDEIYRGLEERNKHKSDDDDDGAPNYGLGMTQDYEEIAARKAKKQSANLNENTAEKEGAGTVGGVDPVTVSERDDADQGESNPQPAVEEVETVEVPPGKEHEGHEKVAEKEGPANVGGVEPVEVPEKELEVFEGKSHPDPAVDGLEDADREGVDVEILSVRKTNVPGRRRLSKRQIEQVAQEPTKKKVVQESEKEKLPQEQGDKNVRLKMKARKTVPLPQKMPTRTKEEKSLPESLLSPYKVRTINSSDKLTQCQRDGHVVFSNGSEHELNRYDICTLAYGEWLSDNLVDTWCVILNHDERYAAPTSPTRFFLSTRTTMFTIVRPSEKWDLNESQQRFNNKLKEEYDSYCQVSLDAVDMFLFPILHSGHFYVISFNVKNFKIEILDNSTAEDDEPLTTKYGSVPSTLQAFFSNFLRENNLVQWANSFEKVDIKRLKLPWRDGQNFIDCGVFTMRHLETYKGQTLKNYKSGLTAANIEKQLKVLRVKYCAAILSNECNVLHEENVDVARAYYKRRVKEIGIPDLDHLLLTELEYTPGA